MDKWRVTITFVVEAEDILGAQNKAASRLPKDFVMETYSVNDLDVPVMLPRWMLYPQEWGGSIRTPQESEEL
jgi:hypothetical protein